jgi:UDP-2-acetamido-3-amino-2,3-dideoxy-glucuronate N-acetyltransferase
MKKDALVHETASVDPGSKVGPGTRIWHFCHVMTGAVIGANCVLGQNVFVGGTAVIGDGVKIQNNVSIYDSIIIEDKVFCGPSCVFTNVMNPRAFIERKHEYKSTLVKTGATIGANATIVCGIVLGRYCFIGAGSVVTKDVPDYAVVVGVPARRCGWVCKCGVKLTVDLSCPDCGLRYKHSSDGIAPVSV